LPAGVERLLKLGLGKRRAAWNSRAVSSWAAYAEADRPDEEHAADAGENEHEGTVEDMAVGRLRLWLRGVFGSTPPGSRDS
jgi:hypothetical protein